MRRLALAVVALGLGAPAAADALVTLRVEFTEAGDCLISGAGAASRSHLRYPRRSSDLRCTIPAPAGSQAVSLEVVLPGATPRPSGEFPRLAWRAEGGRWIGTAELPATPAFVRVPAPGSHESALARLLDLLVVAAAALAIGWSLWHGRAT